MKYFSISVLLLLFFFTLKSQDVAPDASSICPILLGAEIPDTKLSMVDGELVSLRELAQEKPTVIIFYRGGWCPYCSAHLKELKDAVGPLADLGYQTLAISADKPEKALRTYEKKKLPYTVYSDSKLLAAKAFGIAFQVDDAYVKKLKMFGISMEKASGETHHWLPVPGVFIFGKDGELKFSYVNPTYTVRLSGDVLMAAAKAALKE